MYSILIIDDEPIVKIALRSILPWEEHGFSICGTASNGLEAMSLIEKHQPDVIITDLKMPEMDGLERAQLKFLIKSHKTRSFRTLAFKLFLTKCRELYRKSGERSRGDFLIRKPESIGG